MPFARLGELWRRIRRERQRRRETERVLDALFEDPEVLAQGRLAPRHRHRLHVLEVEPASGGEPERLLLGIVRHPKAHPLAPRGDEVAELLEYRPRDRTLRNVGSRNLTREGPPEG